MFYKGKKIPRETVILPSGEINCPRCGIQAQVREHRTIGPKQRRKQYYYSRWYYCLSPECETNVFSFEEDKVFPGGKTPIVKSEPIRSSGEKKEEVWGPSTYSGPPPWED